MSVYPEGAVVDRDAILSGDLTYRYRLDRSWHPGAMILLPFIMLNPSTADHREDDPTIRRCVSFARASGYDGLAVFNLFAYRATNPKHMPRDRDTAVGPENDRHLRELLDWADDEKQVVVAGWGALAPAWRVQQIMDMPGSDMLYSFGVTAVGAPRHPLYVRGDTALTPWRMP